MAEKKYQYIDLDYLSQYTDNDKEFMVEMMEMFIDRWRQDAPIIDQLVANNDWKGLGALIHKIKPSIQMVGIVSIKTQVQEVENLAGTGSDIPGILNRLESIKEACNAGVNELLKACIDLKA